MTIPVENRRHYKYYDLLMVAFVTVLLCSNLIGPGKSCALNLHANIVPDWNTDKGWFWSPFLIFGAGNIFFPLSYIFDDVLTEVYGYARARKVIWAGFLAMVFATFMSWTVINLPLNPKDGYSEKVQKGIEICFGNSGRIVAGSILAFWAGDFVNSFVLAKMKILTKGRWLWTRTIGSTIVGEGLDCILFYPIALTNLKPLLTSFGVVNPTILKHFDGWDMSTLVHVVLFNWFFKVLLEIVLTPFTYAVVAFLKKAENEDYFDRHTNFTPFSLKD